MLSALALMTKGNYMGLDEGAMIGIAILDLYILYGIDKIFF